MLNRGVSHLIFPDEVQNVEARAGATAGGPAGRVTPREIAPPPQAVDDAVGLLRKAKRPVVIVGHGARFDMPAIVELAGKGPRLIVIGGELRTLSQALVGPLSTRVLDELYLDHAFVGTFSLSLDAGLTTTDPAEAFTKEHVLTRTREAVLLVDGSKLGTHSFAHAGRLEQLDVIITDADLDEEASATFEHAGIRVLVA